MEFQNTSRRLASVALAVTLAACGGGGSDPVITPPIPSTPPTPPTPPVPPTPSLSGTFVDGPVAGLSYTTSGSYSGVTDAQGNFKYNTGETVTFKVGNLTLGSTTGKATVGPVDLSTDANKVSNMFVLLQSLDADSVDATITLPASVANANLTAIDLSLAPATFGSSGNAALVAAQTAAGVVKPVVAPAAAQAHVAAQFWKQAEGIWTPYVNGAALPSIFAFDSTGNYMYGQTDGATRGMERGSLAINPLTANVSATVALDTNGEGGFSHPTATDKTNTLKIDGADIVIRTAAGVEERRLKRITNDAAGVIGAWVLDTTANLAHGVHLVFLADGHFMLVDPTGDNDPTHPPCGGPGVEYGTYTHDKVTNTLSITGVTVDTNGCAGVNEPVSSTVLFGGAFKGTTALTNGGATMTLKFTGEASGTVLYRVSK